MCVCPRLISSTPPAPTAKWLREGRVGLQGPQCLLSCCYTIFCSWTLQLKVWFPETAAASYENLLKTQTLRPNPGLLSQSLCFHKTPGASCAHTELSVVTLDLSAQRWLVTLYSYAIQWDGATGSRGHAHLF